MTFDEATSTAARARPRRTGDPDRAGGRERQRAGGREADRLGRRARTRGLDERVRHFRWVGLVSVRGAALHRSSLKRGMQILFLARHGQSLFNVDGTRERRPRTRRRPFAARLARGRAPGAPARGIAIDLCVTSEFPRARDTARLALGNRADATATIVDPDLNDIRIGELEGDSLDAYRAWKRAHPPTASFPGGESLGRRREPLRDAFERLLDRPEQTVLCVCHEIPVRYAVNAALGSRRARRAAARRRERDALRLRCRRGAPGGPAPARARSGLTRLRPVVLLVGGARPPLVDHRGDRRRARPADCRRFSVPPIRFSRSRIVFRPTCRPPRPRAPAWGSKPRPLSCTRTSRASE